EATARPLLRDLHATALEHYEAGWRYVFAIPRAETRMRLACAWPLLIGLETLELLARSPRWLDPAVVLKVERRRVYGLMARSLGGRGSCGSVSSRRETRRRPRR